MFSRSIQLLKKNPVIIVIYAANLLIMFLIMLLLYPKNMNQFDMNNAANIDFAAFGTAILKMLISVLIMGVLGLIFYAGFGYMMAEAVSKDKTSINSFLPGLKKYLGRVLLMCLLMFAMYMGISIVLSMLIIPFTIMMVINGNESGMVIALIPSIIVVFTIPFVALWSPAIFLDNIGVIEGLKNGFQKGAKNYLKLLLILFIIYIPVIVYMITNYSSMSKGEIFTPGYIITIVLTSIISIIVAPMLFMIYQDSKPMNFSQLDENNQNDNHVNNKVNNQDNNQENNQDNDQDNNQDEKQDSN